MINLPGDLGGGLSYSSLQSKYQDFGYPEAEILLNGKRFKSTGDVMIINDISVELTSDYEASIARFRIFNVFDTDTGKFRFTDVNKQVLLGTKLEIKLGYVGSLKAVFIGFVAEISFGYEPYDMPYIEVVGMDIKGIMMSSNYSYQLTAKNYGDAVKEILTRTAYQKLSGSEIIRDIIVNDTPDKSANNTAAVTIEMVAESDYEFVVKAAKKYNFEFFTECNTVYFRKAKDKKSALMTLGVGSGISSFDIHYSITGLTKEIEARNLDVGQGTLISASKSFNNGVSSSGKASGLFGSAKKIYVDPSINSQKDANARVEYLMEKMSYTLGELNAECVGIPELLPGHFVELKGLGKPVDNSFYITYVVHEYKNDSGYKTKIKGKASEVKS